LNLKNREMQLSSWRLKEWVKLNEGYCGNWIIVDKYKYEVKKKEGSEILRENRQEWSEKEEEEEKRRKLEEK
jgi:ribosomal protein L9